MALAKPNGTAHNRWVSIAFGVIAALTIQIQSGATQAQRDIPSTAEDVIRRLDLQTQVPQEPEPVHFKLQLPSEVLWVVVALALAVLLYSLRDLVPLFALRAEESPNADESTSAGIAGNDPTMVLAAADELAAQGRYVEAMHALLLRGLADIRARLDEPFADSLTSREILRSTWLPQGARESLRDVVGRVEWTYFGERPAGHEDYVACRTSFNALEQVLRGSMAA